MKERYYFPALDGLRFLAFFAVFLHHGPDMTPIPGFILFNKNGWSGVDLFLCLSAFLFVHLLRTEWERTGTINVGFFYLRRALRIWPIYFIFTTAVVIIMNLMGMFSDFQLLRAIGLWTFTDNLFSVKFSYNQLYWVGHLWTISYEEQFYLIIPWFLRFIFKHGRRKQFFILSIIFLVGLGIRAAFIIFKISHPAIWVLPITHFESILFGLAIGLGLFDIMFKRIPVWLTTLAGIACLYISTLLGNVAVTDWWLMLLYPMVGISVALLVHSTLRAKSGLVMKGLGCRPIAFLGKISYGLYLFHLLALKLSTQWVTYNFGGKNIYNQNYLIFAVGLGLTILISSISYLLIEKPFLQLKSRFTIVQSRPA